jgi:signal transduction histidine kinase
MRAAIRFSCEHPAIGAAIEVITAATMIEAPTEPGPNETALPVEKAAVAAPPAAMRRYPLRFVWQIDAVGRFTIGSDEFIALIGPQTAAALGRPWDEVSATFGLDPEGHLARALATHETWSGLLVPWPIDDSEERLTVELSGLPVFDRDRAFRGFRGFGVCRDLARLTALAQSRLQAVIEPPPPEPEELPAGSSPAETVFPASSPPEVKAPSLSPVERHAFHEIARRLTERLSGNGIEDEPASASDTVSMDTTALADPAPSDLVEKEKAASEADSAALNGDGAEKSPAAPSDFLARVSHEIRTPLNTIIGFCEVMMEERFGPVGSDRYRQYLQDIHASGGRLIALVNDLLDLSRIEAGQLDLTFTSLAINDLVRECVATMQPPANQARIIIRSSLSPKLPQIVADARSIRQIVLNLISSSIRFTSAGGQVIVSTALSDRGEVVLRVRDPNVGMSAAEIAAVLEPFAQIATSTRLGSGNADLRLPLTKALAEANRANFHIESKFSAGTLVEISFRSTCLWSDE